MRVEQVMVATDDNEVTVGARSSGGYQIPCRYLIDEILTVGIMCMYMQSPWRTLTPECCHLYYIHAF